jgi:methyl-accepting chemotaxis protein
MSALASAPRAQSGNHIGFMQSLRGKLLLYFLLLALVPMITVGVLSYIQSQTALEESARTQLEQMSQVQAQVVEQWFTDRAKDMDVVAGSEGIMSMDPESAREVLQMYGAGWGIWETIFLSGPDGVTIATSDDTEADLSDRDYFQKAIKGSPAVSDALISAFSGNVAVVFASPVITNGQVVGVVAGTVPMTTLADLMSAAQVGNTGEVYLVNHASYAVTKLRFEEQLKRDGRIQERTELEFRVDTDAVREALAGKKGSDEYVDYRDKQVVGGYAPVQAGDRTWAIIAKEDCDEAYAAANSLRNVAVAIVLVASAVVAVLAVLIARSLATPMVDIASVATALSIGDVQQQITIDRQDEIGAVADAFRQMIGYQQEMAAAAERIAEGDLTADVTPLSEVDALGNAFARMLVSLRNLIGQVQDGAGEVAGASSQINAAADQTAQASQQVANTIQQVAQGTAEQTNSITQATSQVEQMAQAIDGIAKGAQEQARAVERASASVTQMTSAIDRVAGSAQASAAASQQAAGRAEQGADTVNRTVEAMATIKDTVADVGQKVLQMQQHSAQIGAIVETIDDIAEQTNLLALNAAIEAARAGEQGRGFAVVADEVRKLAERSGQATKEIAQLIQTVQQGIEESVAAMDASLKQVEAGSSLAGEAGDALAEILTAARQVNDQIAEIASVTQEMSAASSELVGAMDSVSAVVEENTAAAEESAAASGEISAAMESVVSVSEENSAAAEEVSAMTEEMSAQAEEMTASSHSLAQMAQRLQDLVAQFRIPTRGHNHHEATALTGSLHAAPEPAIVPAPALEQVAEGSGNGRH